MCGSTPLDFHLTFEAPCLTLEELLDMSLFDDNLRVPTNEPFPTEVRDANIVDLISMDIESLEFDVLENFPFYKYYIRVFVLEANTHSHGGRLDLLMTNNSYFKIATIGKDAVYVHTKFLKELQRLHFTNADEIPDVFDIGRIIHSNQPGTLSKNKVCPLSSECAVCCLSTE